MRELSPPLVHAPVALVCIDRQDKVTACNGAAQSMGIACGETMSKYLPDIDEPYVEHVRHQAVGQLYRLVSARCEKRFKATWLEEDNGEIMIWLHDMTEQLAIASRIREDQKPLASKLRQLNQLSVTASGYSELIEVVMEDEALAVEKISTLRQYHAELSRNLTAMLEVLRGADQRPERAGIILVADAHQDLAQLIAELLRAEGYRAECFSDATTALRFLKLNDGKIKRAIVDEELNDGSSSLVDAIGALCPGIQMVTLSAADNASVEGKLAKPVDFEQLLTLIEGGG